MCLQGPSCLGQFKWAAKPQPQRAAKDSQLNLYEAA